MKFCDSVDRAKYYIFITVWAGWNIIIFTPVNLLYAKSEINTAECVKADLKDINTKGGESDRGRERERERGGEKKREGEREEKETAEFEERKRENAELTEKEKVVE